MSTILRSLPGAPRATRTPGARAGARLLTLLCVWLAASAPAAAQSPKMGADFYADETEIGFRVHVPAGWVFIPPTPSDGNVIAKYAPKSGGSVVVSAKEGKMLDLESWILKFDRRPKPTAGGQGELVRQRTSVADIAAWVNAALVPGYVLKSQKDLEIAKLPATEYVFIMSSGEHAAALYAMVYRLPSDVDVAVAYIAPGDANKWGKYESEFKKLARSFKKLELKAAKEIVRAGDTLRDKKRALLQKEMANQGGWKLYETANYFIASNNEDKEFLNELMKRLEAIRAIYEQDYPASRAQEIRAATPRTGDGDHADPNTAANAEASKPPKDKVDPIEASKTSVVRVCKNREQYMTYGGPPTAAGHWSPSAEELVIFDDKVGGRNDTWAVLNHEAFHQYIFYFYGNIAPHSWYNEGTGDFYSGYEYNRNGSFTLKKFAWRVGKIGEMLNQSKPGAPKYVPLSDFVRMSQKDYYAKEAAPNKWGTSAGQCYAQGWSFIYFLRTGKKSNATGWNPRWETILDDYLRALASSGKVDQAVELAFTGVDMDDLERAWIAYTK